ncbi:MAG: PEP-CTERM sorting domain-containing protein [Sedimentisphaerales bacterium]
MKKLLFSVLMLMVAATMVKADLDPRLHAWWTFDEGANPTLAYDSSIWANTGLLYAETAAFDPPVPIPGNAPTWTTDRFGNANSALLFNEPGCGSVRVAQSPSLEYLDRSYRAWSLAMWIRQDSTDRLLPAGSSYQRVISSPTMEVELGPGSDADYTWPYYEGNWGPLDIPVGPTYNQIGGSNGQWYNLAITYDGQDVKEYLSVWDGDVGNYVTYLVGTTNVGVQYLPDDWSGEGWLGTPMAIGTQIWPVQGFYVGALDDVTIIGNGYIDAAGVQGLANGQYTPGTVPIIPEPATLVLLGLGGLLLRKRVG